MSAIDRYRDKTPISYKYVIGDKGPGGGIIFLTPTTAGNSTGNYFEVSRYGWDFSRTGSNAEPYISWSQGTPVSYQATAVTGADGIALGTGYQNTLDIIAQGNGNIATCAAKLANNYYGNKYTDWFLPSKDELNAIYTNIKSFGIDTFDLEQRYWSSSELDASNAYLQNFSTGSQTTAGKVNTYCVRPIRMFSRIEKAQRLGNDSIYGKGSDGVVVISANTSLSRDMYYSSLTINLGANLNTNGFRVFVQNSLMLNGNIGISSSQTISTGTLSGRLALGSGNTSVSLGGNSGGNTYIASQLSSSDKTNLELVVLGVTVNTSGTITSIKGGASGVPGTPGTVTPATNGGAGSLNRNALVPGGPGTAGTTPSPSAGGNGGSGGAIVLVVAKQIVGSGSILSQGQNATVGSPSSSGSAGTAAPSQALTHLADNSAHYITGNGTTGPHASVTAPALPHAGHVPSTQNRLHGYTYRYVHTGNTHHTHNNVSGDWHADHGVANTPFAHHYNDFNDTPHVDTLTGTYTAINSIPHNHSHRNQPGVAYTYEYSHYSGAYNGTHDVPHHSFHEPASDYLKAHFPASHGHRNYPRHHYDHNHSHFRARNAGTVSSQGSNTYPGGTAGLAGSSTAGATGITGGGGGIIIITDAIANTVVTSTIGGSVSGGGTGQSGTVLTILNQ